MTAECLAMLGGKPLFDSTLAVGQWYMPPREELDAQLRGIFERQFYTENGPLVRELEAHLGRYAGVLHAICVANASVAFLMLTNTLRDPSSLLVPALATDSLAESFPWFTHRHITYDLDPAAMQVSPQSISASLEGDTSGILLVDYWSGAADIAAIRSGLGRAGLPVFADSTQSFGGRTAAGMVGSLADATVVSLHHASMLSAGEGACIFTNDADLADQLRTMRSSSGVTRPMPVGKTVNGRMSEAQAALALISLAHLDEIKQAGAKRCRRYETLLRDVPGISPVLPHGVEEANHEHMICQVDPALLGITAGMLRQVLEAENVGCALPVARVPAQAGWNPAATAGADRLADTLLRLPSGSSTSDLAIMAICDLLHSIPVHAEAIRQACAHNLGENPGCCQ